MRATMLMVLPFCRPPAGIVVWCAAFLPVWHGCLVGCVRQHCVVRAQRCTIFLTGHSCNTVIPKTYKCHSQHCINIANPWQADSTEFPHLFSHPIASMVIFGTIQ